MGCCGSEKRRDGKDKGGGVVGGEKGWGEEIGEMFGVLLIGEEKVGK